MGAGIEQTPKSPVSSGSGNSDDQGITPSPAGSQGSDASLSSTPIAMDVNTPPTSAATTLLEPLTAAAKPDDAPSVAISPTPAAKSLKDELDAAASDPSVDPDGFFATGPVELPGGMPTEEQCKNLEKEKESLNPSKWAQIKSTCSKLWKSMKTPLYAMKFNQ